ncbi:MAG: peroxiredoxin family protein [Bacteroidales bacterium]|nr:peroxiredoxin family protein [Bacteroidales bacterium]
MSTILKLTIIAIFLILNNLSIAQIPDLVKYGIADKNPPQGISVGEKAPLFIAKDYQGNEIDLQKYIEKSPVVLIFYRGNWCPVCSKYLKNYSDSLKMITDKGAAVLFITPETAEGAEKTVKKTKLPYTIVIDDKQEIMKNYDVLFEVTKKYNRKIKTLLFTDIAENNQEETAHLPVPATFIIDKTGTIVWRQFDPNYKNRASTKDILKHLPKE